MLSDQTPKQSGRLVACLGLPRSASTLVFNLALSLLAPTAPELTGCYTDDAETALTLATGSHDRIVLKSHSPAASLLALLALNDAPQIVSVRDPRDAVSSLMGQFGWSFDAALDLVAASSEILQDTRFKGALVLRYEDFRDRAAEWVSMIASYLRLSPSPADLARIAQDLGPDSVRKVIDGYVRGGLLDAADPGASFHPVTHWHPNHVGDGEVAKFETALTAEQAASVFRRTREFCRRFGYAAPVPASVTNRLELTPDIGFSAYLGEGFSAPEPWGTWTDGLRATLRFPLAQLAIGFCLTLEVEASPGFAATPKPSFTLSVNELKFDRLPALDAGQTVLLVLSAKIEPTSMLVVDIDFDRLRSPASLSGAEEGRLLGLGMRSLSLQIQDISPSHPEVGQENAVAESEAPIAQSGSG